MWDLEYGCERCKLKRTLTRTRREEQDRVLRQPGTRSRSSRILISAHRYAIGNDTEGRYLGRCLGVPNVNLLKPKLPTARDAIGLKGSAHAYLAHVLRTVYRAAVSTYGQLLTAPGEGNCIDIFTCLSHITASVPNVKRIISLVILILDVSFSSAIKMSSPVSEPSDIASKTSSASKSSETMSEIPAAPVASSSTTSTLPGQEPPNRNTSGLPYNAFARVTLDSLSPMLDLDFHYRDSTSDYRYRYNESTGSRQCRVQDCGNGGRIGLGFHFVGTGYRLNGGATTPKFATTPGFGTNDLTLLKRVRFNSVRGGDGLGWMSGLDVAPYRVSATFHDRDVVFENATIDIPLVVKGRHQLV